MLRVTMLNVARDSDLFPVVGHLIIDSVLTAWPGMNRLTHLNLEVRTFADGKRVTRRNKVGAILEIENYLG
jgi:hypothetical protein